MTAPPVNLRRLAVQTVLVTAALVVVTGVATLLAREHIVAGSRAFVALLGGPGIWLGWAVADAIPFPIIPDAFSAAGLLGGMPFGAVAAWACTGSLSGGLLGYAFGAGLRGTARYQRVLARTGVDIEGFVHKHGPWALAVAALTPLPYSAASWVCGAGRVSLALFVAVSMLRVVRVAGYLWLITAGAA
jgi:membrane protein YqaA with SNARE-associated domain